MNRYLKLTTALASVAAIAFAAPAMATPIPDGTVSVASIFTPMVDIASTPSTYTVAFGNTIEVNATGGFASANGLTGTFNGMISFSNIVNATIAQTIPNLFVFNDGQGGTFNYSLSSITTRTFINTPDISTSISLYALGTVLDSNLGYDATPAGLTISFNSTGGSPYSSSETLSVPPADSVPEPGMLALFSLGTVGLIISRRRAR